jgi:hypothetical protein
LTEVVGERRWPPALAVLTFIALGLVLRHLVPTLSDH